MFIEKLTDEQIKNFFTILYPVDRYKLNFSIEDREIRVYCENLKSVIEYSWYERYTDFYSSNNEEKWVKYLYKIFGESYKEEYLKECAKIFN